MARRKILSRSPETVRILKLMDAVDRYGWMSHDQTSWQEAAAREAGHHLEHLRGHLDAYERGESHELGEPTFHLAAAAVRLWMEYTSRL